MTPHSSQKTPAPAGPVAVATAVVVLQWRRLRRDPVGLMFTLALPLAITIVLGTIYMAEASGPGTVGLVVADASDPVAADLAARLDANPLLDVRSYADRAALDRAVRRRSLDGGVVIPAGLSPRGNGTIELVGAPGVAAPDGLRAAVEATVAETSAAVQLGAALVPDDPRGAGLTAARSRLAESTTGGGSGDPAAEPTATATPTATAGGGADRDDRRRDAAADAVMATLVLFVFVNTMGGASSWAEARELGVVGRLRSSSAPSGALAWGFGLGSASYAAVQGTIVLAIGVALFDVPLRAPVAVAVVLAATAAAAGGLSVLVATVLPTGASGTTVAGPIAFVLGMLGGCLWPLDIVPPALAALGRITPHLWALEGLQHGAVSGVGTASVAGPVAALAAITLVAGAAGGRRMARSAGGV